MITRPGGLDTGSASGLVTRVSDSATFIVGQKNLGFSSPTSGNTLLIIKITETNTITEK